MSIDSYQHYSFDLWLTLIKPNPQYKLKRNRLMIEFFGLEASLEEVEAAYSKYDRLFNTVHETTGRNMAVHDMWLIFLDELGCNIREISEKKIESFTLATEHLFFTYYPTLIEPGTADLFRELNAQGKTISLLSNTAFTQGKFLRKLLVKLDVSHYFSFFIFSDEVGHSKPSPFIFQAMYEKVKGIRGLTHKEILHIGDNPVADYGGAKSFGIGAALVKPNEGVLALFGKNMPEGQPNFVG